MKKIIIILLLALPVLSFAQQEVTWDYPVKPGSEEWKGLKNQKEKLEICQIPENILKNIPTEELMELCFNYPLIYDVMAFNSTQRGIDEFKNNFNGFNEFVQRKTAADLLIKRYSDIQPRGYDKNWTDVQKGYYSLQIIVTELFLSQNEIINKMTLGQKQGLARELLKKLEEKKDDKELYGKTSQMSIGFALSRILQSSGHQWKKLDEDTKSNIVRFTEHGSFQDVRLLPYIVSSSKEFLKH